MFSFQWPWALLLLLVVPLLAVWFLITQRSYWRDAFAFSQLQILESLSDKRKQVWSQRIVPGLLLFSLSLLIAGLAQPVWKTRVATQNTYLMLVLDISISMEATDLRPNRLEAAKRAAIEFTQELPGTVQLGLVYFAGNSYLLAPPSQNHRQVLEHLKALQLQDLRQGTAIGEAILSALDGLSIITQQKMPGTADAPGSGVGTKQPQGSIILLTDGENNLGIAPQIALGEATQRRVTISTVGIGESTGAFVRGGIFTRLDEPLLQEIAAQTGGQYYRARSFKDFKKIYRDIAQKTLGLEEKTISLMPVCIGLAMLALLGTFVAGVRLRRF